VIRLGLRVPACAAAGEVADFVAEVERAGLDYAWIPDTQLLSRDVWVTLALAADRTSRLGLGTAVTNPITRDASVTASAAVALQELAPGRFVLGIGSGHSSVRPMGQETSRLSQLRETIAEIRELTAGQIVERAGKRFRLHETTGRAVPIYLSATGPRMLQLAGEQADGVILMAGLAPESLEYGRKNIALGAQRAGRGLDEVPVSVGAFGWIGEDWQAAKHLFQPYAANFAIRHRDALRDAGIAIPEEQDESGLYPDLIHAEDWERAIEVTRWLPSEALETFVEKFCLLGTPEMVAEQLRRLEALGVRDVYVRGIDTYALPRAELDGLRQTLKFLKG
jgi:5,10-methylenetetrahydromethanopterin reductase